MPRDVTNRGPLTVAMSMLLLAACQAAAVKSNGDGVAGERGGGPAGGSSPTGPANPGGFPVPDAGAAAPMPEPMSCASQLHTAQSVPLDLLLLVDASGSMDEMSGAARKWDLTKQALEAFLQDPASAELGVGLSLFPGGQLTQTHACQQDSDCADVIDDTTRACRALGVCYAPGVPIVPRPCAIGVTNIFNCPAGLQCRRAGRCSQSGTACVDMDMGQPCAAGNPSDVCQLLPGSCRTRDEGCQLAPFGTLDVDIGALPAQTGAVMAALGAREPAGSTPMTSAVDSALTVLERRLQSHPDRRSALVLATDGLPGGCGTEQNVDSVAVRLERARAGTPGIPTYVVGVFAADEIDAAQPALERFARVGGSGTPFILQTGDDLAMRLLDALKEIRGQAVACEYSIPAPQTGSLDYGKVNVRTSAGGAAVDLQYVESADRCQPDKGGWYYDTAPGGTGAKPRRVILCPQSCARLRGDPGARVDLVFGCATRGID